MVMHSARPSAPLAAPTVTPGAVRMDVGVVTELVDSLVATGVTLGQAFGHAAGVFGDDAVWPLCMDAFRKGMDGQVAVALLDDVATAAPATANRWLNQGLASHLIAPWGLHGIKGVYLQGRAWVTSIPDSLEVPGDCWLDRCPNLKRLPDGLHVHYNLDLTDSGVQTLGSRLRVGQSMHLVDCADWDGIIPEDAIVTEGLYLDSAQTDPISLGAYRTGQSRDGR